MPVGKEDVTKKIVWVIYCALVQTSVDPKKM